MIPEKYRKDEEIIRLTIEQIKKDFGMLLPELVFSGDKSMVFEELKIQVSAVLKEIKNTIAFRPLLYRVDMREQEVVGLEHSGSDSFFQDLAEKMIQREFQKVLTRKYFSGKE